MSWYFCFPAYHPPFLRLAVAIVTVIIWPVWWLASGLALRLAFICTLLQLSRGWSGLLGNAFPKHLKTCAIITNCGKTDQMGPDTLTDLKGWEAWSWGKDIWENEGFTGLLPLPGIYTHKKLSTKNYMSINAILQKWRINEDIPR